MIKGQDILFSVRNITQVQHLSEIQRQNDDKVKSFDWNYSGSVLSRHNDLLQVILSVFNNLTGVSVDWNITDREEFTSHIISPI